VDESYPHLRISREEPVNERRPGTYLPSKPPADPAAFGRRLQASLEKAVEHASQDLGGFDERRLFRFEVEKGFQPDDIRKLAPAGIELVSQEDGTVVVAFASAQGQAEFEARLATLAEGGVPTNKQVFYALRGVDRWTPEDRTGWALRQEGMPEAASFILDVELWPLESRGDRNAMRQAFDAWLQEHGITALDKVLQPALLLIRVRCDREKAESLLNHRDVRTVDLPPRYGLEIGLLLTDVQSIPPIPEPPEDAPGITVLDSGVATGHPLLGPAMGDDARSFIAGFPAADNTGHGTHIAGLALYGNVEEKIHARAFVPQFRLFSGRIFDDDDRNETGFVENHIEDAVRYFKDNYGCRIFNLSFGDSRKPFRQGHVRGLAYTLDRISRELDVLFVVSTGNVPGSTQSGKEWRDGYPGYLLSEDWSLIDPAPALNALTVGSLARWDQTFNSQRQTNANDPDDSPLARRDQPSPFTRCGPSVNGAIKPELVAYGGNWAVNARAGFNIVEQGLGELSTNRDFAAGRLFGEQTGSSFAAPHVTHLAAQVLRAHPDATNNLIRALLVAHAEIPEPSQALFDNVKVAQKICGYGRVQEVALLRSLENDVTLIAEDTITNDRHHFYEIPLPEDFFSVGRRLREITVALATTPPIRSTRIDYKASRIDFRVVLASDLDQVTRMFNAATDRDDYESIPELGNASLKSTVRSKGTVQSATWRFRQFNARSRLPTNRLFAVVTRNDFPWGKTMTGTDEAYGLVACLRDRQNETARLYTQIRNRIRERARIQV
jgi:hypothetical protein